MVNYLTCLKTITDYKPNFTPNMRKSRRGPTPLGMVDAPWTTPQDMLDTSKSLLAGMSVIEAFSNCKTQNNDNSSRVGKLTKVYFGDGAAVAGASIEAFFLEKSRVVKQSDNERGFHIFYQVILGASTAQRQKHKVRSGEERSVTSLL